MSVEFFVAGDPAPQGSKSRTRYGGMYESSPRLKAWREQVALSALVMAPRRSRFPSGPVAVTLRFALRIDADIDKLTRSVLDGVTHGQLLGDDKQVTELHVYKRKDKPHGCEISVGPA